MDPHSEEYVQMLENHLDILTLDGRQYTTNMIMFAAMLERDLRGEIELPEAQKLKFLEYIQTSASRYQELLKQSFRERHGLTNSPDE